MQQRAVSQEVRLRPPTTATMMKLFVFAALVAVASAAPGLYGGYGGIAVAQPLAVAHAPLAVAHAPLAVAHAPVATSYANVNLVSRHAVAVQPIAVKTIAAPIAIGGIGHGYGLSSLGHY